MINAQTPRNSMARVVALRDFRRLFAGSATSLLGDQFALITTPWLVLHLTGDPLILGIVLALEGIPRAAFMLLGGAITDRLSPRWVMLTAWAAFQPGLKDFSASLAGQPVNELVQEKAATC